MVSHVRENMAETLGHLLETWHGEIVPGDLLDITPCPFVAHALAELCDVSQYSLCMVCQPIFGSRIETQLGKPQAMLILPAGRTVTPASDASQWTPPTQSEVRYTLGVRPNLWLDFTIQLLFDDSSRYGPLSGGVWIDGTHPNPDPPHLMGRLLTCSWWVAPRQTPGGK